MARYLPPRYKVGDAVASFTVTEYLGPTCTMKDSSRHNYMARCNNCGDITEKGQQILLQAAMRWRKANTPGCKMCSKYQTTQIVKLANGQRKSRWDYGVRFNDYSTPEEAELWRLALRVSTK